VASDLRSELNPSPLEDDPRAEVGAIRVIHAAGATFAIAHESRRDVPEVVLTIFEDGTLRRARTRLPSLHGIALSGRHLAIASLTGGAQSVFLHVQQLTLTRDERAGETSPGASRRRVFCLGEVDCGTARARQGALLDAASLMAQSLSATEPESFALEPEDASETRARFVIRGAKTGQDLTVRIGLRADGSAVVNVRLGPGEAHVPQALGAFARVRTALTGDDDGDPTTSHFELGALSRELGSVVMAIWALRLTR
jgi:hypothetical protein